MNEELKQENQPENEPNEQAEKNQADGQEHGENWVTHLYDKANVSVNTLNLVAIGLILLIFGVVFFYAK